MLVVSVPMVGKAAGRAGEKGDSSMGMAIGIALCGS